MVKDTKELIGLEVCQAIAVLKKSGETNFKFVYYTDRKQNKFDKEIVTAVRRENGALVLVVCRYLLEV